MRTHATLLDNPYVFLAIEFGNIVNGNETKVLGVYTTRAIADGKVAKTCMLRGHSPEYKKDYGVIKKPIEGRTRKLRGF